MRSYKKTQNTISWNNILLFLLITSGIVLAQQPNYFIFPEPLKNGVYKHSVGLGLADLPEDHVEEASDMIRGPIFNYQLRYGLPKNFNFYASVNTNIVTFHFSAGPRWHYRVDQWAFGLGYDLAYWFGTLNQFGYKSKVNGWFHYPNITIGYASNKFALSLKGEIIIQTSLTTKSDEVEVSNSHNSFNGTVVGIYIEQPLWKQNVVIIGLKMYYTRFYYPIWAALPTFDRYFYIPEITIGFNL